MTTSNEKASSRHNEIRESVKIRTLYTKLLEMDPQCITSIFLLNKVVFFKAFKVLVFNVVTLAGISCLVVTVTSPIDPL